MGAEWTKTEMTLDEKKMQVKYEQKYEDDSDKQ